MDIRTKQYLEKEIPNFRREIQTLYRKFDKEFGLHGADVPMVFRYDEELLGSYTPAAGGQKEQFFFSLFFIGFCNKEPMHRLDKIDLYAHEYAHYMQAHMEIPKEHLWQPGKHGSAWKYCCSLVGAAPTPYYRIGEGLQKHDYDKALYNPWADQNYTLLDQRKQKKTQAQAKAQQVEYQVGEEVSHPKFGPGKVEEITRTETSVRLKIRFADQSRVIDQKWLSRQKYQRAGEK